MSFTQNHKTKNFITAIKTLIETGAAGSVKEVAGAMEYSYTALNQIMNGKRNVPIPIYKKFTDVYKIPEIDDPGNLVLQTAIQNQAYIRTLLRGFAELLSLQRNENVMKTLSDLEVAAAQEERLLLERLRKMEGS